jgi:transcriptional regulator with XRE-family HTH domain
MKSNYKAKYKMLGLNIAYYRKLKGFTQLQFSEILDIDRSHLSGIELGNNAPSLDLIFKICEELKISEKELLDFRK